MSTALKTQNPEAVERLMAEAAAAEIARGQVGEHLGDFSMDEVAFENHDLVGNGTLELGGEPDDAPALDVTMCDIVVFIPRPGERRGGRFQFPAIVLQVHDDGAADILIFRDADDTIAQRRVPRSSPARQDNCWRPSERAAILEPFEPSRLNALTAQANSLEEDLAEFRTKVFGEYAGLPGGASIMAFLEGMSKRLRALEKASKPKK